MPLRTRTVARPFLSAVFAIAIAVFSGGCGSSPDIASVYHREMQFDAEPEMVVIASFDGLRPDAIAPAGAKHLQSLGEAGITAKSAKTIIPSITLPSHSSMLSGVSPEKHGIYWNGWEPSKGVIQVPTLFDEAKKKGLRTAMIVGKEKFKHLARPGTVDEFYYYDGSASILAKAVENVIRDQRPNLLFVHFAHADNVGHDKGWMSEAQFEAIHEADQAFGMIITAIKDMGLLSKTAIIATSDHGGEGKGHGDGSEVSTRIPWFAVGAGVPRDAMKGVVETPITTYDTAATAASLLKIPVPTDWHGKPAF